MSKNNGQLKNVIGQAIRFNSNWNNTEITSIKCEDLSVYGMSVNKFQSCNVTLIADNKEQSLDLIIKKWVPGGITDVDLWLGPQPREFLAFNSGIFSPDSMPAQIDIPIIGVFNDSESGDYILVLRDFSKELTSFRFESDLSEIHRKYSIALDKLALMHATWEKPEYQARLGKLNWLVTDSMRLSRGELLARHLDGFPLSKSDLIKIENIKGWIEGARIQNARVSFYNSLSESDAVLWKHHETDRSTLITEFNKYPKTLVHGDFWPFNIGLHTENSEEKLILIDWEWIGNGCSSLDVAKLLSTGAALDYKEFNSRKLADYYFERYIAHGGTLYDYAAWNQSFELAELYHALIVHSLATGLAILDDSKQRECRENRTPYLTELITKHPG